MLDWVVQTLQRSMGDPAMARNVKQIRLGPGIPPKDGVVTEVVRSAEHWNEYTLEDGTALRLKPVITEVLRIENEFDSDGNPVYIVRSTNVLSVDASEKVRKKA